MQIIKLPMSAIKPYEKNAKKHTPEQIEHIKRSIEAFGFNDPIGIWGKDNIIIEGHGRYRAQKERGVTEIECIRLDHLSDEERRAYALVHNKATMETPFDMELLPLEIADIAQDLSVFGFDTVSEDEFGQEFKLEDGAKKPFQQISLTLHDDQAALLLKAIKHVYDAGEVKDYGGNENHNGNGMFEVVKQWATLKGIV